MFCCNCGTQSVTHANYCYKCGHSFTSTSEKLAEPGISSLHTSNSTANGTSSSCGILGGATQPLTQPAKTLSFKDFMRQKEHDRQSRFEPKDKKFKPNACKGKEKECEVSINIGYMKVDNDGNLKRCRGKTLPIKVLPSARKSVILEKAVRKHANHDKNIHGELEHVLLNGDGNEITTLPGTEKEFVLREYREDVGKNYNRLTLFIALKSAYMYAEISKLKRSCDDSEPESTDLSDEMLLPHSETDYPSTSEPSTRSSSSTGEISTRSYPSTSEPSTCSHPRPSASEPSISLHPSASEPTTSTHPRTSEPTNVPNRSTSDHLSSSKELECECPTCLQYFSIDEIAEHADICCDIWVGAITHENTGSEESSPNASPDRVIIPDDSTDVKDSILEIKAATLSPKVVRLNVRRKHIWSDFNEYRSNGKVSPTDSVKIVFVGECAIDDGGPKREFFSEMLEHIERRLFSDGKPINSTVAIINGDFRVAGEIMVMSILQGGPAPSFISPDVYRYITRQTLKTEGMPDSKYKETAEKITKACDNEKLREILVSDDVIDMLSEVGYTGVPHRETVDTVSKIVQSICIMGHFSSALPQIMQLEEGLNSCGLINYMRENPKLWEPLFDPRNDSFKLSADKFLDEIIPTFSSSQIYKEKEIDVYKIFSDYVQTLEIEGDVSISVLLKWLSGCKSIPVLGFPKKFSVTFVHGCKENCKCRPTTSTCDLLVRIPVHISNISEMEEIITSALNDCAGFGCV